MRKFEITIKETRKCVVEVEASNLNEALEMIEEDYFKNANDYFFDGDDTEFFGKPL